MNNTAGLDRLQWHHPVQMVMASERIRYVPADEYWRCRHDLRNRDPFEIGFDVAATFQCEARDVPLFIYAFPFDKDLGFTIFIRMGLCNCGTLYIAESGFQEFHLTAILDGKLIHYRESVKVKIP